MASDDYRVDYAEITRVYRTEKKDALTGIPPDFYTRAMDYVRGLESAEKEMSGSNRELAQSAQTQIREARKLLSNIWEFRTRKLTLIAVSQRRTKDFHPAGLAREEEAFLATLMDAIREHENSSLRERAHAAAAAPAVAARGQELQGVKAHEPGREAQEGASRASGRPAGRLVLLRFTANVPKFATEFGEFDIRKEDVAFLPEAYSRVLIERKVATAIDAGQKKS